MLYDAQLLVRTNGEAGAGWRNVEIGAAGFLGKRKDYAGVYRLTNYEEKYNLANLLGTG